MPTLVTYSGVADSADVEGALFTGKKFFITQRIPQRSRYVQDVETNGGVVVKLEAQADYIIADHVRKDAPAGSLSYKFIETAIKNGEIPLEEDHVAGPPKSTFRPIGSVIPGRHTRVPFTAEDDRLLYTWVKEAEAQGLSVKGNELYKQLETLNPRHTFQSWRDRYIKQLLNRAPAGMPTPPSDASVTAMPAVSERQHAEAKEPVSSRRTPAPAPATKSRVRSSQKSIGDSPAKSEGTAVPQATATPPTRQQPVAGSTVLRTALRRSPEPSAPSQMEARAEAIDDMAEAVPVSALEQAQENIMPGFENEDFDDWLRGAAVIEQIPIGRYNAAFLAMAKAFPEHTAEEWMAYYEQVVLPVYEERKGDDDDDMLEGFEKHRLTEFFQASGARGQPLSTSSRRLTTAGTPRNAQVGLTLGVASSRSIAKLASQFKPEGPKPNTSNLPSPLKRNLAAVELSRNDAQKRRKVEPTQASSAAPVSATQRPSDATNVKDHISISSDKSSDDKSEALEGTGVNQDDDDDDAVFTSDVDAAVQTQLYREMGQDQRRAALTADNLALAQAQNNPRPNRRALDIVPDDEAQDQDNFAGYLEGLLHGAAKSVPHLVNSQDIDSNIDYSSPVQQHSLDRPVPLDPDIFPQQSPYVDPALSLEEEEDGDVQLDLPEPEGGWSIQSSQDPSIITRAQVPSSPPRDRGKGNAQPHELSTQAIFATETQQPDLEVPLPPSPAFAIDSQAISEDDDIMTFIDDQVRTYRCTEREAAEALYQTSFRQELGEYLIREMVKGSGVPKDVPGIWTVEDDQAAEGTDATKLRLLAAKHGSAEVDARLQFLQDYRDGA